MDGPAGPGGAQQQALAQRAARGMALLRARTPAPLGKLYMPRHNLQSANSVAHRRAASYNNGKKRLSAVWAMASCLPVAWSLAMPNNSRCLAAGAPACSAMCFKT